MKRAGREPKQLPLLPAADFAPKRDPVGDALGAVDADPDAQWALVMDLFGRMAVRAYHDAHEGAEPAE